MKMFLTIFIIVLCFFLILAYNALKITRKSKKLLDEKVYHDENSQIEYAKKLSKIIQCKTVSSKEGYDDTEFAKLRDVVKALFPTVHKVAEKLTFSDDCWVYKIEGKDKNRNIMIMSHHDVVEAKEEWKYGPFSGEIAEGKLWGRGCVDTKTPLFAELEAVEELLNEGFEFPYNLYIGSSHNEEIAGDGIPLAVKYFKDNNITFDLVLDEGGAIIDAPIAGMSCKCAMLAVHEKGRHTLICKASEASSHAGLTANTETPVVRMSRFITEVSPNKIFIRRVYPEVKAMFEGLCPYMTFPMRLIFANLWCFSPLLKVLMPKLNAQAGAMIGTSCAFTKIEGGKSEVTKKNECTSTAFLRCVNDEDLKIDIENIKKVAKKYGVTVEDGEGNEYYKPADMTKPGFSYVKKCVGEVFPHVACAPFILPAGSDARHLTDICKCVIRFAPIDIDKQQFASVHSANENISIKSIANAVVFYKHLLKNY